ncbi:hypothetical protein ACHAW6_011217 [Cyclotella cf. meneghiniana]
MQNAGSLAGYDAERNKIWDSHSDADANGRYSDLFDGGEGEVNVVADKIAGSSLVVDEEGVAIVSEGGDVTWRVVGPNWDAPTRSPVDMPTRSPVAETARPTRRPTGGFRRVFLESDTNNTTYSSVVENIVVDLYNCSDSDDATWILLTRTNATGHFIFSNDDSSQGGHDLSNTLQEFNITRFRAEFSQLSSGYTFTPTLSGSNVNSIGQTACWDLETNGRGSIVWNAGVMIDSNTTQDFTNPPINSPPTNPPTTQTSTSQPTTAAATDSTTALPTSTAGIIGGYAFFDSDDNGIRYPDTTVEPALTNINVELFSCGKAASTFDDDIKLAVDRTNAQGMYAFRNLTSGYYRVDVEVPTGYALSSVWTGKTNSDGQPTDPNVDSTVDPETGTTPCFKVIKGTNDLSWGIGLKYDNEASPAETPVASPVASPVSVESNSPSPASSETGKNSTIAISGFVFYDKDDNGYFEESEEEAISNVDVALFNCNGTIVAVSSTDENGMYGFDELKQGSYNVKFSLPSGYEFSNIWSGEQNDEGDLISSDADSDVDPNTGLSPCQTFSDSFFSLDAGMFLSDDGGPSSKPTNNPKGDGTPCSGSECDEEGMCRNVAGVCGSGLSFCNPQSVWTPSCVTEKINIPTLFPVTVVPTISSPPTISHAPFRNQSPNTASVCNADGTYGETTDGDGVMASDVTFQYSLLNESGESFEDAVALFERELNSRLACHYFEDSCLNCGSRLRGRSSRGRRTVVEGSSVVGISSEPNDQQNPAELCADQQNNCRVMNGILTAYFPIDTPFTQVVNDKTKMLEYVQEEMAKDNWGGVIVGYANEPLTMDATYLTPDKAEIEQENKNIGGFPLGAIIGIAIAGLVALGAIVSLFVFFVRDKRQKEMERMQPRIVQQEYDSQYLDEDDDSDDSSSLEEDNLSGGISSPSAVSGSDSYPTTMAQATPQDIENDGSSDSSSSTSSESDDDEDEESGEYDVEADENDNVENLKTSASSDEPPPVYEQDDMGEYNREDEFPIRYLDDNAGDQNYNYDRQQQQEYIHDDPGDYNDQPHMFDDDGSGGSMGSMNSADPPGRSFRDLHQDDDDWNNMLSPPQSSAPRIVEDDFYVDHGPPVYENDEASNPESYHSSSSRRSGRSNPSIHSNRSRSNENNQSSYHSFYDDEYIGEVDQSSNGSRRGYPDQDYDDFDQHMGHVNSSDYEQTYIEPQYNSSPPPHDDLDSFYAHAQPVMTPSYSQQQNRLVEYGDDTTTYSDSTRQVSNIRRASNSHHEEQLTEANFEPSYDEEEESISNIFKSLSEIQTKLAKKGKTSSNGMNRHTPTTIVNNSIQTSQQTRWGHEGVVEDASMDGSQMSSFETRAAKNKRPQHGAWMEPVDEYDT